MKVGLPEEATPQSIWTYYTQMQTALSALRSQWPPSSPDAGQPLEGFEGMSLGEFEEALVDLRRQLDEHVTLALVASFEATLRVDFVNRSQHRRPNDSLTQAFRALYKAQGLRPDLTTILDLYKNELGLGAVVGQFKQLLRRRHWLAHGRYWTDKSGITPDPYDAWAVGQALLSVIPTANPDAQPRLKMARRE